jgi:hypothetical protein
MRLRLTSVMATVLTATTAVTLSACGPTATSTTTGNAAGAKTTPTTGKVAAGTKAEDGLGHPVTICQLLPVATVAQLTGEKLTVATEDDTVAYKIYACDYKSADGTAGVRVSVLADQAKAGYDATLEANGAGAHQISGLGDKAFSAITGVEALFGDVSITVSNLTADDAAVQIIRALQPKL